VNLLELFILTSRVAGVMLVFLLWWWTGFLALAVGQFKKLLWDLGDRHVHGGN
jgi:hypothetical protein